jgi:hypothetical protein
MCMLINNYEIRIMFTFLIWINDFKNLGNLKTEYLTNEEVSDLNILTYITTYTCDKIHQKKSGKINCDI